MRKHVRSITIALLLALSGIACLGQDVSTKFASADLRSDLAVLRRAYEELHPGLYRYNTRAQMAANFTALDAEFGRDLTLSETYLAFSIFLAKIKCGHSYANFFNQTKPIADALFKQKDKVPFYFRWIDGRMIVVKDFSGNNGVIPGTEILTVNGVSAKTIRAKLLTVARADGSNDAKRIASLEVLGLDRYEAFDVFYPLFYPQKTTSIALTIKQPRSKQPAAITVEAITYEQRLGAMDAALKDVKSDEKVFDLAYIDSKTAVLRMPSWGLYDSKWDWKKFIDDSFDELIAKNIPNLIIDIRPNEGGIDAGDAVISRLIDKDLEQSQTKRLVRYRKIPTDLQPYLDTWDRSFDDWGDAARDPKDGFYTLTRYDDNANGSVIKPSGTRYTGRVFLLVAPTNSSATFQFAQLVKRNKLATLVGQPTGGNQRGINGGAFYFLRLPKTKIEMDLPLIGSFPITAVPDAGIEPDIYVKPSTTDISTGKDTEINAVKQLIKCQK